MDFEGKYKAKGVINTLSSKGEKTSQKATASFNIQKNSDGTYFYIIKLFNNKQ